MATADQEHASRSDQGAVLEAFALGFPWATIDPFLAVVHHVDLYPAGDERMGPATLEGRRARDGDPAAPGWSMYHGSTVPGFPQHPHRGFETVTVVRRGTVDHADSLGATARYGAGDVQWLTAGSGIQHAEMFPLLDQRAPNHAELFQIWLNLPSADKMADPSFTMLWREELPVAALKDGSGRRTEVTVVAGAFGEVRPLDPPPDSWASREEAELAIWQFVAEAEAAWTLPPTASPETVRTLYAFQGSVVVGGQTLEAPVAAVVRSERPVEVTAGAEGAGVLVLQGRPIGEPVALGGPFVMNTRQEIEQATRDYRRTGFGGWPWPSPDPVHSRSTPRFAHHPDGRTEYPEGDA